MTICDIDEFSDLLVGWDSDWRQLEAGQSANQIALLISPDTVMQSVRLSHAIHQQGSPPKDLVTFGIPRSRGPLCWGGRQSTSPGIFNFNGKDGYDCVSGKHFDGLTLSFPRWKFISIAEELGLEPESFLQGRIWELSADQNCALAEFRDYAYELFERSKQGRDLTAVSRAREEMDEQLPLRLIYALASLKPKLNDPPLRARQAGLRRAIEFMEDQCHRPPGIPEVSVSAGLSWRSLDRAFKENFGVGPKRYLLNLRLTEARRGLKKAPAGTKVVDVANEWGFWHMGDFAREYRMMFGELPAKTLEKAL